MSQPNLPSVPGDLWSRFTTDPRTQSALRASDADRDIAAEALNVAYTEGRLDAGEHTDRLGAALAARHLGELVPLLSDVTAAPRHPRPTPGTVARRVQDGALRSWLGVAVLFM